MAIATKGTAQRAGYQKSHSQAAIAGISAANSVKGTVGAHRLKGSQVSTNGTAKRLKEAI
jgi:hypothetical protein